MAQSRLTYVPSFIFDKGSSKYAQLTKKYHTIIEAYIRNPKDKHIKDQAFFAANHIAEYILSGTEKILFKDLYEGKNARDKVTSAIFTRMRAIKGSGYMEEIREDLEFMALEAVYVSLGISSFKKRNLKWIPGKHGNFIRYTIYAVYMEMLNDFAMKEIMKLDLNIAEAPENVFSNEESVDSKEMEAERIIEKSPIGRHLSEEMKEKLKLAMLGLIPISNQIKPYLMAISSSQQKG